MAETAEIVELLEDLTPEQREEVVAFARTLAAKPAEAQTKRRPVTDYFGILAPMARPITLEDIRENRDAMAAELEAKWASREI